MSAEDAVLEDGGQGVVRIKPMGAGGAGGERSASTCKAKPMAFSSDPPTVVAAGHQFTYPLHVIGPEVDQHALFNEFMPARIAGFLDGYNVNVLAYGQTGSGKTHTVFGTPGLMARTAQGEFGYELCAEHGIFPRGMWAIFDRVQQLNSAAGDGSTTHVLTASCVELGLWGNQDMMVKSAAERNARANKSFAELRAESGQGPQLDKSVKPPWMYGMVELPLDTPADLLRVCEAIASRNTAGTLMNDSSSRSHCICWLTLFAYDSAKGLVRRSRFQFADLAGSERLNDAHGADTRLTFVDGGGALEGIAVNFSLTMLSQAVRAIIATGKGKGKAGGGKKKQELLQGYTGPLVPILADSLTGDAITALFVCVSQAPDNSMQSKIALEFGETFSELTMGKRQQKFESLAKLRKDLLAKQTANDAMLAKGVAGKYMGVRQAQALDYVQMLAVLERFGS